MIFLNILELFNVARNYTIHDNIARGVAENTTLHAVVEKRFDKNLNVCSRKTALTHVLSL